MAVAASQFIVLAIAGVVILLSAWGLYAPPKLVAMVTQTMDRHWGIYVAVIVRLILGAALIIVAPVSHFPAVFRVLGWIAIIAAIALTLMGRRRLRVLIAWFNRFSPAMVRVWLLFGIAFGGFLIAGITQGQV